LFGHFLNGSSIVLQVALEAQCFIRRVRQGTSKNRCFQLNIGSGALQFPFVLIS